MSAQRAFKAPTGTHDVLPGESERWMALVARFVQAATRAGFGMVHTPIFEELGVFQRLGAGTDVVRKEMYDFLDKGERHLALRPEGTASVVRAFNQHHPTTPWKAFYVTPCFRYERPQAGRYRQHHQIGIETIGTADPDADVEVIAFQWDLYRSVGLERVDLLVNSMGTAEDRAAYMRLLTEFLSDRVESIAEEDRSNIDAHPMRVLDSKRRDTRSVTADAPRITDHLSPEGDEHFARVREGLASMGIPVVLDPRLVRGLDYYTHTTFEFQSTALESAQNAIGGGGRYDGLAEALGGKSAPGVGFGSGIERILLAADAENALPAPASSLDAFVVDVVGGHRARDLTVELRRAGLGADRGFEGRSMKAQMKLADRSGARFAVIVGPSEDENDEATVRDLRSDAPQQTVAVAELATTLQGLID